MDPDADVFYPSYDAFLRTLSLYPDSEPPFSLLSPDYFQEPAVQVPEVPEVPEEPETRDPGPCPPSLHHPHPDLSADTAVRHIVGGELQQRGI